MTGNRSKKEYIEELVAGISLWDLLAGFLGLVGLLGILVSALPWKPLFCALWVGICVLMLSRIDGIPGYLCLIRMAAHLTLPHHYERVYSDRMLLERSRGELRKDFIENYGKKPEEKEATEEASEEAAGVEAPEAKKEEPVKEDLYEGPEPVFMEKIMPVTGIGDGILEYASEYVGAVLRITPAQFSCFSAKKQGEVIAEGLCPLLERLPEGLGCNLLRTESEGIPVFSLVLFEKDAQALDLLAKDAAQLLQKAGVKSKRLSGPEPAVLLRSIFQPEITANALREFPEGDRFLWSMPETLDLRAHGIRVWDRESRICRIASFPEEKTPGWLTPLFSMEDCRISLKILPLSEEEGRSYACNAYILSEDPKLPERAAEIGFSAPVLHFEQSAGVIGILPGAYDPLGMRSIRLTGPELAAGYPFGQAYKSSEDGIPLGFRNKLPVRVDFFAPPSGALLCGSGSGTYEELRGLLKNVTGKLSAQRRVVVLTPREHPGEILGEERAKILPAGNGRYVRLNPFAFEGEMQGQMRFLEDFLHQLLPETKEDLLEDLLDGAEAAYGERGLSRDIRAEGLSEEDFPDLNVFSEKLTGDARSLMTKYTEGGRHGALWNGKRRFELADGLTAISFYGILKGRGQGIGRAQFLLLLRELETQSVQGMSVVVDSPEAFVRRGDEATPDALLRLSKALEKKGGNLILASSEPASLLKAGEGGGSFAQLIASFQYGIFLRMKEEDLGALELLKERGQAFTDTEKELLGKLPEKEALVFAGRERMEMTLES